jgi:hypothetical protein
MAEDVMLNPFLTLALLKIVKTEASFDVKSE